MNQWLGKSLCLRVGRRRIVSARGRAPDVEISVLMYRSCHELTAASFASDDISILKPSTPRLMRRAFSFFADPFGDDERRSLEPRIQEAEYRRFDTAQGAGSARSRAGYAPSDRTTRRPAFVCDAGEPGRATPRRDDGTAFRNLTFRRSHRGEDLRAIRLRHSFANRRYPGFRSGVPCGPGSSGAFEGSRTILPFARGVRGVSGEGAGGTAEAGGGDSIALTGSGGASIAATGASIGGAGSIRGGAGGGGAGSGALSRSSGVRHANASSTPKGDTGDQ